MRNSSVIASVHSFHLSFLPFPSHFFAPLFIVLSLHPCRQDNNRTRNMAGSHTVFEGLQYCIYNIERSRIYIKENTGRRAFAAESLISGIRGKENRAWCPSRTATGAAEKWKWSSSRREYGMCSYPRQFFQQKKKKKRAECGP